MRCAYYGFRVGDFKREQLANMTAKTKAKPQRDILTVFEGASQAYLLSLQ